MLRAFTFFVQAAASFPKPDSTLIRGLRGYTGAASGYRDYLRCAYIYIYVYMYMYVYIYIYYIGNL